MYLYSLFGNQVAQVFIFCYLVVAITDKQPLLTYCTWSLA